MSRIDETLEFIPVRIAVLTVSDSRSIDDDKSGTFDLIFGLTKGGPGITTETLSSFAYKFYFTRARFGLGSAYGMVIFVLILVLSFFYISRIRKNLRFKT